MKPHPRIRKTVKWGGAVVSVLLLVVWVGSGWFTVGYLRSGQVYTLMRGQIGLQKFADSTFFDTTLWVFRADPEAPSWNLWFVQRQIGTIWIGAVPVWFLLTVALLTTGIAWRLDILARRRARVGFCPKCHYDRTGLAPGAVCPECGAAAIVPPPAAS